MRAVFDAAARRDAASVLALYDPEVEWDASQDPIAALTESGVYSGHDGLPRFFRERREVCEKIEDDCGELIDAGEHIMSCGTATRRGRASGVEVKGEMYSVWTIRPGKIVRVVWIETREEALEAAGLQE